MQLLFVKGLRVELPDGRYFTGPPGILLLNLAKAGKKQVF